MSRISSTFGRQSGLKSVAKMTGGSYITDVTTSNASKTNLRKSTGNISNFLSSATTRKMARNGGSSPELSRIESEYIKNLQQQVYYLELEANYLRQQTKKATEAQPQITAEAERMCAKLRQLQAELDGLQMDYKRKESELDVNNIERERLNNKIKADEDSFTREKRVLQKELIEMRRDKDKLEEDLKQKDSVILDLRNQLERNTVATRSADAKTDMYRTQLEQKCDQQRSLQNSLEEKRTELLAMEAQLRQAEEKFRCSAANMQSELGHDLREQIRELRLKLKEAEMSSSQDRFMRCKLDEDTMHLAKENVLANQQITELRTQLDRERSVSATTESRLSKALSEMNCLKEHHQEVIAERNEAKQLLQIEMDKRGKREQMSCSTELRLSTLQSRVSELESKLHTTEQCNSQLRKDNTLLTEHTADLQKQLRDREQEFLSVRQQSEKMMARLQQLQQLKQLEATVQSQKWDEFARLADSMKSLTRPLSATADTIPALNGTMSTLRLDC